MGRTRIELSGTVVKPPMLAVTPGGRAVLRLSVDCGERPEHLLLDVVMVDGAARELARLIGAGQRICAAGVLRAQRRSTAGISRQQIEVVANEIATEQPGSGCVAPGGSVHKLI
jgi:single-stranded DNA-binding protein